MSLNYLFDRRHPIYQKKFAKWVRASDAYSGGDDYITIGLIKHCAETDEEFAERIARAYYINYPRRIARLITQFIFAVSPERVNVDEDIIADFDRGGHTANQVMRQASTLINCHGTTALLIDMPSVEGEIDMETKRANKLWPYVQAIPATAVTDWSLGADGKLDWAIIAETHVDKSNPEEAPIENARCRLWTRTEWKLYEKDGAGNVTAIAAGTHKLGQVPLVMITEPEGYGMNANHWFEDVVRISDAILNNGSEAQMNIIKQMFGLLILAESAYLQIKQNADATSKAEAFILGRSTALKENPDEKGITRYISPSGSDTTAIRAETDALKKELYDTVGLALQSSSKEAQTAESKAWDANNVQKFLAERAEMFEDAEKKVWEIIHLWDQSIEIPKVSYCRDYSVVDLSSAVSSLVELDSLDAGEEYHKELLRAAVEVLSRIKRIPPEVRKKIEEEIKIVEKAVAALPGQNVPGAVVDNPGQ